MELDPLTITLEEMMRMDSLALHHLAKKSAGMVTRYRVLLGRLLLVIERTRAYLEHGCSGAVHYGIRQLGLPMKEVRRLIRVGRDLENLNHLSYLGGEGQIEWSKLREISRVATPDTQRDWAAACRNHTYAEIEDLVSRSEHGEVPPDLPASKSLRNQTSCRFSADQMAILEHGRQVASRRAGRHLELSEFIELVVAEMVARQPLEEDQLAKARADSARELGWTDAEAESCPGNEDVRIVNPKSRVPTKAQRRRILRRDRHCCAVPGCPNTLWLHVHHILYFSEGGQTTADNVITLCSRCHKNVHNNFLKITGKAPDGLRFLNQFGQDIRQERELELAFWLDIWCGWRGGDLGRRHIRAQAKLRLVA